MKISRTRQAITGMAIAIGIAITLLCGVVLALAEGQSMVSERATPTIYHIPTLAPAGQPARFSTATRTPAVIVIPTSVPVSASTTPAAVPSSTPAPTQIVRTGECRGQAGWQPYRIQSGDTLYEIAYRYGVTVTALMKANCLGDSDIYATTTIYVPAVTPHPRSAAPSSGNGLSIPTLPTGTQTATDGACTNADSAITSPKVGAVLHGHVKIIGTARFPDFAFYKIEMRQEGTDRPYSVLNTGHREVAQSLLAELDTPVFPNGEYWLRLVVVDTTGNYPERCAILVTLVH